ncbi:MAG: T9SS type A sorting domain-containing protein, partial [Bacteroidales bacterium]|nr:T9SS type A sorting domain-containing protein [Bacteroidales bacterium]
VGGTWNTATSNTNSYTITGLTGLTDYEIQVQANCGDGNLSEWSGSITAQTTNVGVEEHLLNSISLFPNPANDVVNVECTMNNVQCLGVEVFDVFGKLINTVNVVDNPTRINVSGLANGMYFVRVTTDEGTVTKTFIKK